MRVLIDTTVWSAALRRTQPGDPGDEVRVRDLMALIDEGRAAIIGPIRQETLSGVRERRQYLLLRDRLRAFPDTAIEREDYERAAEYYSICRSAGIQGSHVDFLICAVCAAHRMPVFTSDGDFSRYAAHLPFELYAPRSL